MGYPTREVLIEGYTPDEILSLSEEQLSAFVLIDGPLVFKVGLAEILGEFRISGTRLIVELAHVDGGGEGVLPVLWKVIERSALQRGLHEVEWIVYATHCAKPNLKLRRVLERLGFTVRDVPGYGDAYYLLQPLVSA